MAQRRKGKRATAEQRDCLKARLPDGATAKRRKRPSAEERATLNGTLLPKRRRGDASRPITRSRHAQRKARSAHAPLGSRAVRQPRPLAGAPFGRCAVAFLRGCLLRGCLCAVAYRPATRGGGGKLLTRALKSWNARVSDVSVRMIAGLIFAT